jgi:NADH:ubiquinone oxidoreductase subunit K
LVLLFLVAVVGVMKTKVVIIIITSFENRKAHCVQAIKWSR